MTNQNPNPDPTTRPGNDDDGIAHATDEVVASWKDATDGKDPSAGTEDFERMRAGFADAAERGTEAGGEDPSAA